MCRPVPEIAHKDHLSYFEICITLKRETILAYTSLNNQQGLFLARAPAWII
jgi:hypothetical protein